MIAPACCDGQLGAGRTPGLGRVRGGRGGGVRGVAMRGRVGRGRGFRGRAGETDPASLAPALGDTCFPWRRCDGLSARASCWLWRCFYNFPSVNASLAILNSHIHIDRVESMYISDIEFLSLSALQTLGNFTLGEKY